MRRQHDLIAFYRHVLRSGELALAGRLGRILLSDPRYRDRALIELNGLLDHLGVPGKNLEQ